jgi:hypothetical protein
MDLRLHCFVLDFEGRIINRVEVNSNIYSIDFGNYANGIYLLKIVSGDKTATKKVIIK